jgi:hypothetical protein
MYMIVQRSVTITVGYRTNRWPYSQLHTVNTIRTFRITKFCRFGVGILIAALNNFRYKDSAFDRVAGVAMISEAD